MRSLRPLCLAALLGAAATSCFDPLAADCRQVSFTSMVVALRDAPTDEPLLVEATVTAVGAEFADSTLVFPGQGIAIFNEQFLGPDTYTVSVAARGYARFTQADVQVPAGGCHVTTPVHITARMNRKDKGQ